MTIELQGDVTLMGPVGISAPGTPDEEIPRERPMLRPEAAEDLVGDLFVEGHLVMRWARLTSTDADDVMTADGQTQESIVHSVTFHGILTWQLESDT